MNVYLTGISLFCLILSAWFSAGPFRAQFFGDKATGVVNNYKLEVSSDGSVLYYPVVRYLDAVGMQQVFTSVTGSVVQTHELGSTVTIYYVPLEPSVAYISGFLNMWLAPLPLFVMGASGVLIACLAFLN